MPPTAGLVAKFFIFTAAYEGGLGWLAVLGLGSVGLPLSAVFARAGFRVLGFDVDPERVARIQRGERVLSHLGHGLVSELVGSGRFEATADPARDMPEPEERAPDAQVQARAELRALLDQLDEDKRAVVVLYEIEGFSMKEVAEMLGCPLQTAYSRLHAARDRMIAEYQSKRVGGMAR